MINWKVRVKNKMFWVGMIPAIIVLVQVIASLFGFAINLDEISGKILAVVDAVFVVLSILGIVVDPTTNGVSDSTRALKYDSPKKDGD